MRVFVSLEEFPQKGKDSEINERIKYLKSPVTVIEGKGWGVLEQCKA